MPAKLMSTSSLLLTLTAALALGASAQTPAGSFMQPQPAPIERPAPATTPDTPRRFHPVPAVKTSQPAQGIYVRVSPQGAVTTVAATAEQTELRVDSGIANISVHHPAQNSLILVDFAGGQLDLIKDGMYTFNADTRTARVLVGEAQAFPNADPSSDHNARAVKVKEDHAVTFGTPTLRATEFQLPGARGDVLPRDNAANHGDAPHVAAYPGYGFYGGYPYYAYDYPYGWGYPYYGWGYPYGFGLGFGFYGGGFYGGRGIYGGGFRGRR